MPRRSSLDIKAQDIGNAIAISDRQVFDTSQITGLLDNLKDEVGLARSTPLGRFLEFAIGQEMLKIVGLRPEDTKYRSVTRYVIPGASPFEMALSMRPRSYLSHATAVFLHGLTDQISRVFYANQEQTPKGENGTLSQAALNRAFASRQRISAYVYWYDEQRIVLLSGKSTGNLGVITVKGPAGETLKVTDLERTLIDIVVRPVYSGGVYQILDAYRGAREKVSVGKLVQYLGEIGYLYPYHQAIGFLLERAGYSAPDLDPLRKLGMEFDFYLAHGLKDKEFDSNWRLYYPRGF